ncbi:hypothetical protein [Cellulomonas sp. PhB150]|uniref:hypothetical protein n=1 Tax=Cellulomonas sp. PhB150 TaxID=2485188 RepID=UPI000F470B45|nr:hypothetical protein [Cellulomonas sp. PhB150]ROS23075.1 hypothetical protein EDF34_3251 [Cellulomonas sp. PhB150]
MRHLSLSTVVKAVLALVLGLVLGAFGTVMHRSIPPWGVVLALALVLAVGVLVRAWSGLLALLGLAIGVLVSVQVLSQTGPGGDVLVPAAGPGVQWAGLGWVWVLGSIAVLVVAGVLPQRWFVDPPVVPADSGPQWPGLQDPALASPVLDGPVTDEPRP